MADRTLNIEYFSLPDLGALSVEGLDAGKFLQGQLSNDVAKLAAGEAQLTALHTVQGRVQALLRLFQVHASLLVAVLPRELAADVLATLKKRVFRAKVTLADATANWQVVGASAAPPNNMHARVDPSGRCLLLRESAAGNPGGVTRSRDDWRTLDIAAGVPQVYASSQGEFVAQMLNLDLLGGIAFDKGCYIGQEIVARAHYRGRVKRRLQRFAHAGDAAPAPGASVMLASGESVRVVEASRHEMLAVAAIGAAGALPLPYALPQD
jgi:folate-binding protein YgfZ